MPPVASALLARFASYPALSRRDYAALIVIAAAARRRARHHGVDRARSGEQGHFPVHLVAVEFFLARRAAAAGHRGAAVAGAIRHAHSAVAVQVRQADDDGEFRRRDDSRSRYRCVLPDDLSRSAAPRDPCGLCRNSGARPCCGGSIPIACGCASPPPAACSASPPLPPFRWRIRWSRTKPSRATAMCRNSSIPASMRSWPTPRAAIWSPTRMSPANSVSPPQAPASRPPSRRILS